MWCICSSDSCVPANLSYLRELGEELNLVWTLLTTVFSLVPAGTWMPSRPCVPTSCVTWPQQWSPTSDGVLSWRTWSRWSSRSHTHTGTPSQSSWNVCMWTSILMELRRSSGSANKWVFKPLLLVGLCQGWISTWHQSGIALWWTLHEEETKNNRVTKWQNLLAPGYQMNCVKCFDPVALSAPHDLLWLPRSWWTTSSWLHAWMIS